jgi:DNA-binding SARP family transcriptional activator/predicted ATPase
MSSELSIRLFGDFTLIQDGQPVSGLDSARLQALLACLVLHRGAPQLRYHLAFLFWPDSDEVQARTNLRNLLHRLRRVWPEADRYLTVETKSLTWRADADISLDVADFEEALGKSASVFDPDVALSLLQQAIALYQDDLLPSCYDDWISPIRRRLRHAYVQGLERHAELLHDQGDSQSAIRGYRRLVEAEPLQEAAYSRLIDLYESVGDRAAALRVYHQCATVFRRELGIAPGAAIQSAYRRLLALDSATSMPPVAGAPVETQLIGRSVAWEQLRLVWQEVSAGRRAPCLVLIEGEAGIGKTRLAEELTEWVRHQSAPDQIRGGQAGVPNVGGRQAAGARSLAGARSSATTAVAACYAAETQLAFSPVVSWLRAFSLSDLAPVWRAELVSMVPDLAEVIQARPEASSMPETWQKARLYEALTQAVLSQPQPILLRLEDLQWCDAETLAWLHHLLRADPKARMMLVATYREEEIAVDHPLHAALLRWQEQGRLLDIRLGRLSADETAELAATLKGEPLTEDSATALYRYTEGNPLFIVETIRSGMDATVATGDGHVSAELSGHSNRDESYAAVPVPPGIQTVLRGRLSQLSPPARRVLDVAAVIGRSFTVETLWAASGIKQDDLFAAIDEMWRRRIVHDPEGDVYDFSHDKLRQVTYLDLSPARRRWLHGRVAQTLEAECDAGPGGAARQTCLDGRVAFHYEAAGQAERALHYRQRAAAAASRTYAFQEAAFHLQRAVVLSDRVAIPDIDLVELHEQLGDAHTLSGQHEAARQAYEQALTSVGEGNRLRRAELTAKLASTWLAKYELERAAATYETALTLLPPVEASKSVSADVVRLWLEIRLRKFDVLYYAADLARMAAMIEETMPYLEAYGSASQRLRFFQIRAELDSRRTRYRHTAQGVAYARSALQLAEASGDAQAIHGSRFAVGFMLLWQAEPDIPAAIELLQAAASGSQAVGNAPLLDRCLAYLTVAYRRLGRVDVVREMLPRSLRVAESEQNALYIGVAHANQAWLAYRDGAPDRAASEARHALSQWRKLVFPFHWLACWPFLAAAVDRKDLATAVAQARAMMTPEQQRLPDEIEAALQAALADPKGPRFRHALTLARSHNML